MTLLVILLLVLLFIIIVKPYFIHYDTLVAFTGGLGSGKSFMSVKMAIKLLKKNRFKVKLHNVLHPKKKRPKPLLYSSIPLRISRREYAEVLTAEHLLLREAVVPKSVVFIDEIGAFANQFEFKNPLVIRNFNEFVRLFRHYTRGGYLVCNDQCSENIVLEVRRRINTVFNLMHFKKFLCFCWVKCRNISVSEEIKTVEEGNTEDNMRTLYGVIPLFMRHYDTHCYAGRYSSVPAAVAERWKVLHTNRLLSLPAKSQDMPPLTTSAD